MKYKCIAKCAVEDTIIMNPGDIIVMNGNQLYNITRNVDYKNIIDLDRIVPCLEPMSEDTVRVVQSDADKFKEITKGMCDVFRRKNHDYGNSFEQSLDEEGLAASRIRMGDKWNRFKSLSKGEKAQVNDESLRDTLLDMANYAIMTVMWMDKHGNV